MPPMSLSPQTIKYILIAGAAVLVVVIIGSLLWDFLKIVAGVLIGGGLIYLGFRFLLGKGLPKSVEQAMKSEGEAKP